MKPRPPVIRTRLPSKRAARSGGITPRLEHRRELRHPHRVGVVAQRAALARRGDRTALVLVGEVVPHALDELVGVAVGHDLGVRLEELGQVLFGVGDEQ